MTELDRLPPDQRAVLSLVLDRGKSYGEVAEMLAIPESAVRDRAHAALDALANDPAMSGGSRPPAPARTGAQSESRDTDSGASNPPPGRPRDTPRAPLTPPSSRTAGALLLGGIVVVIVVAVILLSSGGSKSSTHASTTASNTQSTSTSSTAKPSLNKTIALTPVEPALKANGTAYVLSQSGRHAFYVAAHGLPASSGFFYAVWLYNSPSSSAPLGRAPTVGTDGRMEGGGPLPTNAANYNQLIITRETSTHPAHPGEIVLRGTFGLH
jgi:Sigma-70, region 4/Anti-sigma-K factor rskA